MKEFSLPNAKPKTAAWCAVAIFIFLQLTQANAKDVYIWTDENGKKHFTDLQPANTEYKKVEMREEKKSVVASEVRSTESIARIFQNNRDSLFSLYEEKLKSNPSLGGLLLFELVIKPDGSVTECEIVNSQLDSRDLEIKLVERIKQLDFGEENVVVTRARWAIDFSNR